MMSPTGGVKASTSSERIPRHHTLPPNAQFTLARVSGRETAELARKLAIVAFIRVAVVTLALGALFFVAQMQSPSRVEELATWHYVLIGVTYALSIVYAMILRYRALLLPLAYCQIVLDTVIVTVLVSMTGGIESVFAFVYVFTVISASMTLYRRGAVIATICYFILFGTLVLLQVGTPHLVSQLPHTDFGHALFAFFMYSVGIALVGVLSSALAEQARISGRQLAETQIDYEQLEELHAAILRALPAGLVTIDGESVVRYANEAALAILRLEPEQAINRPLVEVAPAMAAHWRSWHLRRARDSSRERFEETVQRPDGRTIRLGFSFAPFGEQYSANAGSIAVFQDVTEIVRLKDAYERAERLATVGKLAAGLAHEVRNPLASMCASIDVLKSALEPPEPMKRLMTNVVHEADRLNGLITDFLDFARPRELKKRVTDVSLLVEDVVNVFKNDQLLHGARLELSLESGLFCSIDSDQIRQVIWNIAKNGAEAISSPSGTLNVQTRRRGSQVEIVVRDTGPGVSPEQMKRLFVPFYTTKERGSGLGLAISHAIIEAHGGRIMLESKSGEGTEVTISLGAAGSGATGEHDIATMGGLEPAANLRN